ncbi:Glucosyl-3-phosphoglycerate synthase [Planctomycetes bacterium Pan216]|uniref:Glucosyl-3-phosphoglycerate synthase n=1 Tax=Kolteria novifilia TaxID=2527975 RepID=A0A518BCJ8_9BACT|nr:Glucosyl-3-phosphoglycerate synthase [Planctomycetes bacterium Pan216]
MADFLQNGLITTLHDFAGAGREAHEELLREATVNSPIGLLLPVTASDMRAAPFERICEELTGADYVQQISVVLGQAPDVADYKEAAAKIARLGDRARILWTDGERVQRLYQHLDDAGLDLGSPGKGKSVWTAFGYFLSYSELQAYVLHDCDIANYDRDMLARLCLPLVHPSFDFEFCKAYYARYGDRLFGRVVRLLVTPILRAMMNIIGHHQFLLYLDSYRYPLSGEFAVTPMLARYNRIPSDWGLEVGTLSEVYRNTSLKRVCQVDLCPRYDHKHQILSEGDPSKGLTRMGTDILISLIRTLGSMGVVFQPSTFVSLRSSYLRAAQDAIRQYQADAVMNGLNYDRHSEETAVETFAQQVMIAGESFMRDPAGSKAIPNWTRILSFDPDFPQKLRTATEEDANEFA